MAPPNTPSPHRFLLKKSTATSTPSRLSQQVPQEAPDSSTTRPASGPTHTQLSRVPRFVTGANRRASFPPRSPSPDKGHFPPLSTVIPRHDDQVEDAPAGEEDDEMLDSGHVHFTPLVHEESIDSLPEPEKTPFPTPHVPPSQKRRRLDVGDATSTPQSTPGRFILPFTEVNRRLVHGEESTQSGRPAFLTASLPVPEPAEPLAEAFSPRRRGQKFMGGGLAAEVQSWVIETAQTASQSRHGKGFGTDDTIHNIKITTAQGESPMFVRGQIAGRKKNDARAILVDGQQTSQKSQHVRVGDVVSIRAPTWEVRVLGETWIVGVDWRTKRS